MLDGRSGASLPRELGCRRRLRRQLLQEELQGHGSPQLLIIGPVHYAHPATAQLLLNAIVTNCLAQRIAHCFIGSAWRWRNPIRGLDPFQSTRIKFWLYLSDKPI